MPENKTREQYVYKTQRISFHITQSMTDFSGNVTVQKEQ